MTTTESITSIDQAACGCTTNTEASSTGCGCVDCSCNPCLCDPSGCNCAK
jgi:hypothetical protein